MAKDNLERCTRGEKKTGRGECEDGGGGVQTEGLHIEDALLNPLYPWETHMGGHPRLTSIIILYMQHYGRSRCLTLDLFEIRRFTMKKIFTHCFEVISHMFFDVGSMGVPLVSTYIHGWTFVVG